MKVHLRRLRASAVWFTAAASFIYMVNTGIRNNFGLMLSAITEHTGLAFASVSFVLAVGQLCYGATQPFSGLAAERYGNRRTLLAGAFGIIAGAALLPLCRGPWTVMLVLGILLPGSLGVVSYGLLIGSISPHIPESHSALASGMVNASSGIGSTLFAPLLSAAIIAGGLPRGMAVLTALAAATAPVTLWMCREEGPSPDRRPSRGAAARPSFSTLLRRAGHSRDYGFIALGFFTCGFHMALITNHLATEIVSFGFTYAQSSRAFSIYGIASIIGALVSGALCTRVSMKNLLGTLYGLRTAAVLAYLLLPKTMVTVCGYIILLGLTGTATVTPVSGICRRLFGETGVTIFYSIVFFFHQIGGFLSAWLGGVCFARSGAYLWIWLADAALCTLASAVSFLVSAHGVENAPARQQESGFSETV